MRVARIASAGSAVWATGVNAMRLLSPSSWALLVSVTLAAAYLRWTPRTPDLAAQVARTAVARDAGSMLWWTGWFGGMSMPTYSLLSPSSMAALGVRASGVLAAVVGAWLTPRLLAGARRPRAGGVAFAVTEVADLAAGRVTFVIGATVGIAALAAVRARRGWLAIPLAVVAYFASPLAGLFLGIALSAVLLCDASRRRAAVVGCVALLAVGATMAILFPGTGTMPVRATDLIVPALCCVGTAIWCAHRVVRTGALLLLAALLSFYFLPGAVGDNTARLAWVCAAPIAVAYFRFPRRHLVIAVALLAAWPAADLAQQLWRGANPSASARYYQPLLATLRRQQALAGAGAVGERVEVVEPKSQWSVAYLATKVSLARGWDRQSDAANDPIFYQAGALTAASYHAWLHQLAVGWVALPDAPLDYAARAEGALVRHGLSYLQAVWSTPTWTVYRVRDATPLATGARVTRVTASSVTLISPQPGPVAVRVRWSPYLIIQVVRNSAVARAAGACLADAGGWLSLDLPAPGTYRVTSHFDLAERIHPSQACPSSSDQ